MIPGIQNVVLSILLKKSMSGYGAKPKRTY
jgi:hypothetical protein